MFYHYNSYVEQIKFLTAQDQSEQNQNRKYQREVAFTSADRKYGFALNLLLVVGGLKRHPFVRSLL